MGKTAQGTVTVGDILDDYLLYLSDKPTYQAAESAIRLHLRPAWGGMSARALRRADIVALADRLGRQGKRRLAGYCTATVRTAFNRARADGRLPRQGVNPAADLRVFLGRRRKRVATTDELARLHTALSAMAAEGSAWPPAIALYRLLLLTGARPCELRLVRWGDLDWHRRVLRLQDHKTATLTGEDREIHLSTAAFELVTALPRSPGCPFILPGRLHGEAMQDPTSVWRRACARAGIEDLNPLRPSPHLRVLGTRRRLVARHDRPGARAPLGRDHPLLRLAATSAGPGPRRHRLRRLAGGLGGGGPGHRGMADRRQADFEAILRLTARAAPKHRDCRRVLGGYNARNALGSMLGSFRGIKRACGLCRRFFSLGFSRGGKGDQLTAW